MLVKDISSNLPMLRKKIGAIGDLTNFNGGLI